MKLRVLLSCGLLTWLTACAGEPDGSREEAATDGGTLPVIQVTATYDPSTDQHLFQVDRDTVSAGWTTVRFVNASPVVHFVFLDHLPGERTSADLLSEVSPAFQQSADLIREGRGEEAMAPFETLPAWFGELVFRGGTGFTSPGLSSEATLYLEPGNYVLECYIKTAEGVFHWGHGMHADLHVTDEATDLPPPADPNVEITTAADGLTIEGQPVAGTNVVAVHFQEERQLIGRDVHVARIDADTDLDALRNWMDFNLVEGLVSTAEAPAPAQFIGGIHDLPNGTTGYFTVDLEPGDYVWISEFASDAPRTYQRFTVSGQ